MYLPLEQSKNLLGSGTSFSSPAHDTPPHTQTEPGTQDPSGPETEGGYGERPRLKSPEKKSACN